MHRAAHMLAADFRQRQQRHCVFHHGVAVGAVISCLTYGWVIERFAVTRVAHVSLATSVLVTLGLLLVRDEATDFASSVASSLAWTR